MAKFTVGKGLDEYLQQLENLQDRTDGLAGRAIYEGAKIVADKIRANIEALPVQSGPVKKTKKGYRRDPTQVEKDGLLAGLGVSKKRVKDGFINVKIGMDGYNSHVTEKYPQGHPNAMVLRSIEAGSTYMKRHRVVNNAVFATRDKAEEAMKQVIEQGIEETVK